MFADDTRWSSGWHTGTKLLFKGISHSKGMILQKLHEVQQRKICTLDRTSLSSLGTTWPQLCQSDFAKEDLRILVDKKLFMNQHHDPVRMKSSWIFSYIHKIWVEKSMHAVFPFCLAPLTPHLDTVSSCWPPNAEEMWMNWSMFSGAGVYNIWGRDGKNKIFSCQRNNGGKSFGNTGRAVRKKTDGSQYLTLELIPFWSGRWIGALQRPLLIWIILWVSTKNKKIKKKETESSFYEWVEKILKTAS